MIILIIMIAYPDAIWKIPILLYSEVQPVLHNKAEILLLYCNEASAYCTAQNLMGNFGAH